MNQEGVTEKKNESLEQTFDSTKKAEAITPKENNRDEEEDEGVEQDEEKEEEQLKQRKDDYVVFTNEKDLRHHETISIKAQQYKGIALKIKIMNHIQMENVLFAIEQAKDRGITYLRFEDCRIFKKGVTRLIEFCKSTNIIESFGLINVSFEDSQEFKKLVEAVTFNQKIEQFSVQSIDFDEEFYGKTMSRCILESRSLKELDLSYVNFYDPKSFYEMSSGLLHDRCRLGALKLKGINFGQLEGKVMQFILMRNKSLQTLDLSQSSTDLPENLEWVFQKFDQFCQVRNLLAETLNADFNYFIEAFGEALGLNTKLESLSIKENKIKQTQYCNFWELMANNRTLRRVNLSKTEVTDKVCQKLSTYLQFPDVKIQDMNLSRNSISTDGLIALAEALKVNKSIQRLNLSQNFIRDGGMAEFVVALIENKTLEELSLSTNKINNTGLSTLSGFLEQNCTIKVFDISRNNFSDTGFVEFAKHLAHNKGIESLNISRNKDVSDEIGLKELAAALSTNSSISVMSLTGLKIRKPCVVQYFQPALQQNITLKRIIGKLPPGIITDDLKDNITIENEIQTQFRVIKKENKRELSKLALHRVDQDQTQLDLIDQRNELLIPALKFIRYRKIHVVDLSNMHLEDESLRLIGSYLQENPELRSLAIADNYFTDDGFAQVIQALRSNTHLNHLNILGCKNITNLSLNGLEDMISQVNMSLYLVEIDPVGFDKEILNDIITQASLNRAIQEHLKPRRVSIENQLGSNPSETPLVEIKFEEGSKIAQNFDSAIKVWRILEPSVITVMNEQLGDVHVIKLCNFLSGRNLIRSLNLRRNFIGDQGAIAISEYIQKHDKTLTCLELERNEINDEGGEALLKAMQTNMRIETCKMAYGNPLRQKICRQIEREIKANLQIKTTVLPTFKANNNSLTHYEETDRGPEFVRCALKSCELFQILHLSLPDNMIGEKEMNDIAYVISRNTPLKILNLSENVIDTNAAFILAEALKSNSHLRELDLSSNRLGDAGIALLMQPFILQKLQQIEKQNLYQERKKKNKTQGQQSESQIDDDASLDTAEKKKQKEEKQKRIKTKIKKIMLHGNGQSSEALKHIFTALIVNNDLQIMTHQPEIIEDYIIKTTIDSEEAEHHEDKDSEVRSNNSENNNSRPSQLTKAKEDHDDSILLTKTENKIENVLQGDEPALLKDHKRNFFRKILKNRFCKPCRQICFRDPSKPKLSVLMVLFPSCFRARAQAKQFKTSWNLLTQYDNLSQPKVFISLIVSIFLFIVTIIIIPIANVDFNGHDEHEFLHQGDTFIIGNYDNLITVSIIFGVYQILNSLIEWISVLTLSSSYYFDSKHEYQINQNTSNIQSILPVPQPQSPNHRKSNKTEVQLNQNQNLNNFKEIQVKEQQIQRFSSNPPRVCNLYLIMRWLIGSLSNITNYLHILFISLALTAYFQSTNMSQGKDSKVKAPGSSLEIVWLLEIIVAICAIIAGNIERAKSLTRYIFLQPHIYFLLPMTQRNIHLAWILNLQVLAISFESISLSEYMIAIGGPVMPGKKKDNVLTVQILEKNKVESLQDPLASAKYKYQDMPMIIVLLVHIIIGIAVNSKVQTGTKSVILDVNHQYACYAALGLTILQVLIVRADLQWPRQNNEVDINNISEALKIRQSEIEKRRMEIKVQSLNQIENSHESEGEKSSNYTSRSIISNGIGDVMRELEQLNNEDNQLSPNTQFSPNIGQSEQIANEANQKLTNLSQNINQN